MLRRLTGETPAVPGVEATGPFIVPVHLELGTVETVPAHFGFGGAHHAPADAAPLQREERAHGPQAGYAPLALPGEIDPYLRHREAAGDAEQQQRPARLLVGEGAADDLAMAGIEPHP